MLAVATPARRRWLFGDRALLWLLLSLPLVVQTWRYAAESIFYGEYLHWTGVQSARLLIATLALTPLLRFLPRLPILRWAMRRRRDLGLITFAYAAAHTLAYLVYKSDVRMVVDEGFEPAMAAGWVAGLLFLLLALTSNNVSVRKLGRSWRTLHRWVYVAAILTFAHWVFTAFDPTAGLWHAGIVGVLLLARLVPQRRGTA